MKNKKDFWIHMVITAFNLFIAIVITTSVLKTDRPKTGGLKSGFVFDPHGNVYRVERKSILGNEFYDLKIDDYFMVVAEDSIVKFKKKKLTWEKSN